MTRVTITDLARQLSDFVNRVTWRGEEFLIMRGGKPVAALSPVPSSVRVRDLASVLAELPPLSPDELDAFASDMAAVRDAHNEALNDPWQS